MQDSNKMPHPLARHILESPLEDEFFRRQGPPVSNFRQNIADDNSGSAGGRRLFSNGADTAEDAGGGGGPGGGDGTASRPEDISRNQILRPSSSHEPLRLKAAANTSVSSDVGTDLTMHSSASHLEKSESSSVLFPRVGTDVMQNAWMAESAALNSNSSQRPTFPHSSIHDQPNRPTPTSTQFREGNVSYLGNQDPTRAHLLSFQQQQQQAQQQQRHHPPPASSPSQSPSPAIKKQKTSLT